MASAAWPDDDESRTTATRRRRGPEPATGGGGGGPPDLDYLQRPSYCDASFALQNISEVIPRALSAVIYLCQWMGRAIGSHTYCGVILNRGYIEITKGLLSYMLVGRNQGVHRDYRGADHNQGIHADHGGGS